MSLDHSVDYPVGTKVVVTRVIDFGTYQAYDNHLGHHATVTQKHLAYNIGAVYLKCTCDKPLKYDGAAWGFYLSELDLVDSPDWWDIWLGGGDE